jgi:hypothetical protein
MKFCPPKYLKRHCLVETSENYEKKMEEELIFTAKYQNLFGDNFEETFVKIE